MLDTKQDFRYTGVLATPDENRRTFEMSERRSTASEATPLYFTKTDLKEMEWTESLIQKYLPEPDLLKTNPHYASGPKMKLYDVIRVAAIEIRGDFKNDFERSQKRRESAYKAVQTKFKNTMDYLENVKWQIRKKPYKRVVNEAIRSYNRWKDRQAILREDFFDSSQVADEDSDPEFLKRITRNYVRHELTNYDEVLGELRGRVGMEEAYEIIKNSKIEELIVENYPELK